MMTLSDTYVKIRYSLLSCRPGRVLPLGATQGAESVEAYNVIKILRVLTCHVTR